MRLAAAFAAHEARTQLRSLRFRVLAVVYVAAGTAPAALAYMHRLKARNALGAASYAGEVLEALPLLTAVLAFLIALDAIPREREEGSWSTVTLSGISAAGYLLRRWLAFQAVLLPLTALPLLATAGVAAAALGGPGALTAGPFLGPWLMHIVPVSLGASALAVGLGTITGGALQSFLLGAAVLMVVPRLLTGLLMDLGIRLTSPFNWLNLQSFTWSARRISALYQPTSPLGQAFPSGISEAPYDFGVAAEQYLAMAALPLALCAGVLGISVGYFRRTRPDVRPWRISPAHPLRGLLGLVSRLRERTIPDPKPARADLLGLAVVLLAAVGFGGLIVGRGLHYQDVGMARFEAEKSELPAPTPAAVVPGRWRLEGRIAAGRWVDLTVRAEMRNQGQQPVDHLAFELNPSLEIGEATADQGRLRVSRRWDRLGLDLSPAIPPGGRREVRLRLTGQPRRAQLSISNQFSGFHKVFAGHLRAVFSRELQDFSLSYEVPAVSRRRIGLAAPDLLPVPRYEPWELVKDPELNRLWVAEETFRPTANLTLSLEVPRGVFLADACGGTARDGRLESGCRLPLGDLQVAGGRYRVLPLPAGGATVAVFPTHQALGELHLGLLAAGGGTLREAWPGMGDLRRTVLLEWPEEDVYDVRQTLSGLMRAWYDSGAAPVQVRGELMLVNESLLTRAEPIRPESLAAELVATRLTRRRAVEPVDAYLFRRFFRELALQRLGVGPDNGALVAGLRPGMEAAVRIPPPGRFSAGNYWTTRFPALVAALRYRMGDEPLRLAVEEMFSRGESRPASREELYALLEERSEAPLHRMIQDFFVTGALPEPVLEEVAFRRAGAGWRVTGAMRNRGDGEALCKVVLTTALGPLETEARAGAGEAGAFAFTTSHRPQAVLLDPDAECHRLVPPTLGGDRVFFQGGA